MSLERQYVPSGSRQNPIGAVGVPDSDNVELMNR